MFYVFMFCAMPHLTDILELLGAIVVAAMLILVVRARHRGKASHDTTYANQNVCEHLRRALEYLEANGHRVTQVGQIGREMPLEIHLQPPFDPNAIYKELQLEPPVYVSERNVLYCKEDWCELHPR
jgi:hypothetical protein